MKDYTLAPMEGIQTTIKRGTVVRTVEITQNYMDVAAEDKKYRILETSSTVKAYDDLCERCVTYDEDELPNYGASFHKTLSLAEALGNDELSVLKVLSMSDCDESYISTEAIRRLENTLKEWKMNQPIHLEVLCKTCSHHDTPSINFILLRDDCTVKINCLFNE